MMQLLAFFALLFGLFGIFINQYKAVYKAVYQLWTKEIVHDPDNQVLITSEYKSRENSEYKSCENSEYKPCDINERSLVCSEMKLIVEKFVILPIH